MEKYTDYIIDTAKKLLAIPSPTGFTHMAANFVKKELEGMGYEPMLTRKGAVLCDLGGKDTEHGLLLAAHMDTLGAMVAQIKSNGRLKLTNVGGLNPNNTEAETARSIHVMVNATMLPFS